MMEWTTDDDATFELNVVTFNVQLSNYARVVLFV